MGSSTGDLPGWPNVIDVFIFTESWNHGSHVNYAGATVMVMKHFPIALSLA